jgi:pantothenate kinase
VTGKEKDAKLPPQTSLEDLTRKLTGEIGGDRRIVAIAGPPGVGKTTFAESLRDRLNHHTLGACEILPMDGYHFDDVYLNTRGWRARKGAPFTFDVAGFRTMLARLKANEDPEIAVPVFDRKLEIARAGARMINQTTQIIIVEGNYLLLQSDPWPALQVYFDMTIMLQAPVQILKSRLLARWTGLGYSEQEAEQKASLNDLLNIKEVMENSVAADCVVDTNR